MSMDGLDSIGLSPKLQLGFLHYELGKASPSSRNPLLLTTPKGDEEASLRASASIFSYGHVRKFYEDQLKQIVEHVWSTFSLPRGQQIIEVGCGPFGYYCDRLRPEGISDRQWIQKELVPEFIDRCRQSSPHRQIEQGSYYSINHQDVQVITGLSSLDSPQFIGVAVDQIAQALRPGGYFLHIQDVLPGERGLLFEMFTRGYEPQKVYDYSSKSVPPTPIGYDFGFGKIDIVSLFGFVLKDCLERHPALRLIEHQFYNHSSNQPGHRPHRNGFFFTQLEPSMKLNPIRELTALVTLAQKK